MNSRRLIASPEARDTGIVAVQMRIVKRRPDVRFGSLADMCSAKCHVRFAPESRHVRCNYKCQLWAKSGHATDSAVIRLCFADASLTELSQISLRRNQTNSGKAADIFDLPGPERNSDSDYRNRDYRQSR